MKDILEKFCEVTTNFYYSNPNNYKTIINGGNEMRLSKKEGKYKIFTFADKHEQRIRNMKILKSKVEKYSIIDEVKVFNLNDVDEDFISQHHSLFSSKIFFFSFFSSSPILIISLIKSFFKFFII